MHGAEDTNTRQELMQNRRRAFSLRRLIVPIHAHLCYALTTHVSVGMHMSAYAPPGKSLKKFCDRVFDRSTKELALLGATGRQVLKCFNLFKLCARGRCELVTADVERLEPFFR
ncbi:hypothetical protein PENSPDRAFT_650623 [Peniophora sp. CONT]|nr:hypothetical protein PENSPDRAFT_650623 [Peniophora sp. CONT]